MNKHLIDQFDSLLTALGRLNELSGSVMTLILVDSDGRMTGTLTDGDVRRALLAGKSLDDPVSAAANMPGLSLDLHDYDPARLKSFRETGIKLIPVVDENRRPIRLLDLSKTLNRLPLRALIMAGGKGERLRPMTLTVPKPLLKIEGKEIIDYNVEALASYGIDDITVATGYLAQMIEDHFSKPVAGVKVKCIRETTPLGTLGAASMLSFPSDFGNTLVMNSDLLTSISYEDMYMTHIREKAAVTIAVIPYQVSVPFAILDTAGTYVKGIEEKPSYSYFANAGIYIFNDSLLSRVRPGMRTDATDLIDEAINSGETVTYFPIRGTWIDVGSPADFSHASELMRHHKTMTGG